MQLNPEQKAKVAEWIEQGLKLSEIQERIGSECGIRLTYMEVRMLVDDLKLMPKDPVLPPEKTEAAPPDASHPGAGGQGGELATPGGEAAGGPLPLEEGGAGLPGKVQVSVDTLTRPGAMVSGKVVFSDGQSAGWQMDQFGRFGMIPPYPGYKPSEDDIREFQMQLDRELSRMGL